MTKSWEVLEISGNSDSAQILFAHIENFVLGSVLENDLMKVYISKGSKNTIDTIIDNLDLKRNLDLNWDYIEDEDWHLMWKENFTPVRIRDSIEILPDWNFESESSKDKIFIRPGMSFGTGHHETTNLMVETLIDYSGNNYSLLDLGSGSGILSIAGYKLGYKNIHAVEFDLVCKDDFKFNANLNRCSENIKISWLDVLKWNDFNFDIVLANIEKNIIKKIIYNIGDTRARFIFSGLLKEDKNEMEDILIANKFSINKIASKNEWLAIDCNKE
mgnify:CR=1 FL=1